MLVGLSTRMQSLFVSHHLPNDVLVLANSTICGDSSKGSFIVTLLFTARLII